MANSWRANCGPPGRAARQIVQVRQQAPREEGGAARPAFRGDDDGPYRAQVDAEGRSAAVGLAPPLQRLVEGRLARLDRHAVAALAQYAHVMQSRQHIAEQGHGQHEGGQDRQAKAMRAVDEEGEHGNPGADHDRDHRRAVDPRVGLERRQEDQVDAEDPDQEQRDGSPRGLELLRREAARTVPFTRLRRRQGCNATPPEHDRCDEAEEPHVEQAAARRQAIDQGRQNEPGQHPKHGQADGGHQQESELVVGDLLELHPRAGEVVGYVREGPELAGTDSDETCQRQHPGQVHDQDAVPACVTLLEAILPGVQHDAGAELGRQHPEQEHRDVEARPVPQADRIRVQVEEQRLYLGCSVEQQPSRQHAEDADPADPEAVEYGPEWRKRAGRARGHANSPPIKSRTLKGGRYVRPCSEARPPGETATEQFYFPSHAQASGCVSRAHDRAPRPGRAAIRRPGTCPSARRRRSACRRADTSSRRCAGSAARAAPRGACPR